nr:MAG TPA: hypothetical protein [Caudoviricetes sp.]
MVTDFCQVANTKNPSFQSQTHISSKGIGTLRTYLPPQRDIQL